MKNQACLRSTPRGVRRPVAILAISLCLGAGCLNTQAADRTWNGGGDQSSWTDPLNWNGTAPAASDRLFFGGGIGLYPYNGFTAATIFSNITFNADAGGFTLSGNSIKLAAGAATVGAVTNLSASVQTLGLTIDNNGGPRVYNTLSNDIVVTANINSSTLIKEGPFTFKLANTANDSSLSATVNTGTLILAGTVNNCLGSTLTVHTNGIARIEGPSTDQIHFNQRIIMNGGVFQQQNAKGLVSTTLEEVGSLSGSNLASIVENGLANSTNRLDIGGGSGHRGIYSGTIRDGAAGVLAIQVYRNNNYEQFNGTNSYSGVTLVNNTAGAGAARLIVNGAYLGTSAYTVNGHATDATRIAYLCGSGVIAASVINFNANSLLSPGGSLSADLTDSATFSDSAAILTISNAVNLNSSTASLEVQLNGTTPGVTHDQVYIAGSGTFSNNNANLKLTLGSPPAPGDKFTIVNVEGTNSSKTIGAFGSLNGVVTGMPQGATIVDPDSGQSFRISYRAEGSTFDMGAGNGNNIMLEAISPAGGAVLTWRGDAGPDWDITTTANWRTTNGVASTFTNADFVTFDNSGSNNAPLNLTTDLTPATILVNATNNYELGGAGKLTGLVILTKTNAAKLTLTTDNDNSGATLLRQGTIQIGTNGTTGRLSGNVNMRTNAMLIFNRSDSATYSGVISGAGTVANNGTNGTMILTGDSTFTGGVLANAGTLQFGDGTGITGSIAGRITNNATVAYLFNNAVVINNSLSGTGVVNLINSTATARRFTFPTTLANNTFSGTINVGPAVNLGTADQSSGTNQLGIGSTVNVADGGSVLLDRNGNYRNTFNIQGAGNSAGNAGLMTLEIEQGSTIVSNVNLLGDATIGGFLGDATISGQILGVSGSETLTFANRRQDAQSYNLRIGSASGPNLWGSTVIEPGNSMNQRITVTAMAPRSISTNALTLGAHGVFRLNGFDHAVASLNSGGPDGAFLPAVLNGNATTPAVLTVGGDGTSGTFSGIFGNGAAAPLGLTKIGAGILALDGDSTNTGPVTVLEGTLALAQVYGSGSLSNAAVINIASGATLDVLGRSDQALTLNSGQTLKGNGTLNGTLVTAAGSLVNPGASVGTLTVANNINLGGTLWMELDRTLTPNCDRLHTTSGTITGGGTLTTTNLGPALQPGDTFQFFANGISGITANPQTNDWRNGRSYTWQNDLASLGSIKVLTTSVLPPPTLGMGRAGNTLTFSWTGPFKLQAQTNSLSAGLGNNWADYPGGAASPVTVTVNPTNPAVFFRLLFQ